MAAVPLGVGTAVSLIASMDLFFAASILKDCTHSSATSARAMLRTLRFSNRSSTSRTIPLWPPAASFRPERLAKLTWPDGKLLLLQQIGAQALWRMLACTLQHASSTQHDCAQQRQFTHVCCTMASSELAPGIKKEHKQRDSIDGVHDSHLLDG